METPDKLKQTIETVEKMRDNVNKMVSEHPDVKSGKMTPEEEMKEPGYVLYNQITESVIQTLSRPDIASCFVKIGEKLGEEFSQNFVSIIALCMSTSAHNAIVFYDELLKKELQNQFREVENHINLCETDVAAFGKVMEVFKKKLGDLEKEKMINQMKQ